MISVMFIILSFDVSQNPDFLHVVTYIWLLNLKLITKLWHFYVQKIGQHALYHRRIICALATPWCDAPCMYIHTQYTVTVEYNGITTRNYTITYNKWLSITFILRKINRLFKRYFLWEPNQRTYQLVLKDNILEPTRMTWS